MKPWLQIIGIALFVPAVFVGAIPNDGAKSQEAQRSALTIPANVAPHPPIVQPIPFSHKLHVGMGLPCTNCHVNPQIGNDMSLPPVATCMTCHAEVGKDQADIKKLAEFAASGEAIPWARVYPLTAGIRYSHGPHIRAGVQCTTCHGPVPDEDALSEVTALRSMATCISCHQAQHAKADCVTCHAWPRQNPVGLKNESRSHALPLKEVELPANSSPR
jgi:cytochrome c7-like protein/class III cytochrome C family protein